MWSLYLKILALNIGLSNFIVLVAGFVRGQAFKSGDFLFPATIQFLLLSVIFLVLDLARIYDAKSGGRVEPPSLRPTPVPVPATIQRPRRDFGGSRNHNTLGENIWNS